MTLALNNHKLHTHPEEVDNSVEEVATITLMVAAIIVAIEIPVGSIITRTLTQEDIQVVIQTTEAIIILV